jgi:hypothetical protein
MYFQLGNCFLITSAIYIIDTLISDTQHLALLIDERDAILENLEIAETRYIASFRVTTPDPSIADFQIPPPPDTSRPYISRPLPLGGPQIHTTRRRRAINRAFAASSLAPPSFVAPSSYYNFVVSMESAVVDLLTLDRSSPQPRRDHQLPCYWQPLSRSQPQLSGVRPASSQ